MSRDGPSTGLPCRSTCPPDGRISPASRLSRVVLPQPLGPTTATNSPGRMVRLMCCAASTVSPPGTWKCTLTSLNSTAWCSGCMGRVTSCGAAAFRATSAHLHADVVDGVGLRGHAVGVQEREAGVDAGGVQVYLLGEIGQVVLHHLGGHRSGHSEGGG